ncbi:enoyl-CoA hydratase [Streptomyces radicis]|uniref:Enoyl-CoA hydratase n=1 Tax=Streptomyces radicis TaxID=1750517 RepID=A0A3A9W3Y0_9ACTN|nr:enoyl-CoA hydratase [Streptomyces radicis]RKN07569.1 enoyl-CoA hydratase [Streptomyces radicis]RKN13700.1 enoyl-CoA hydratase [Streptomyces radicis]
MSARTPGEVRAVREGAVVRITLANPERRNALTFAMYERLLAACDLADEPGVRVTVLRGAGGHAFAAGTDIAEFAAFDPGTAGEEGLAYERRVGHVIARLLALRAPLVGVVEGPAVGGGLALAAACDVLLATPDARFGAPIARTLGNLLPAPVVARLKDRIGGARTMALLLTAELMDAETAHAAGLVHRVVPRDELAERAGELVERLASAAPLTLAGLKETDRRLAAAAAAVDTDDLLRGVYGSADFREGVAAFLAHRTPRWEGR